MLDNINVLKELKIVFMGTPDFSVPVLKGLIENYNVRAVVTQPDRIAPSGKVITPPIKQLASQNVILTLQPEKIKESYMDIIELEPDLIVTCAYGQILPKALLDAPRLGCINVHASLLPKLRGGAPIHRAIIEGHSETGITIMYMNEGMDQGDIIAQEKIKIEPNDTASSLHDKMSLLGRDLLLKTLPSIIDGTNDRIKQNSAEATYAFTIKREDEKINFSSTKKEIYNQVRGLNSWPGAYCQLMGKILKVWDCRVTDEYYTGIFDGQVTKIYDDGIGIKVGNGEIVITELQLEGKKKMPAKDFLNGISNKESLIGKVLD